MARRCHSFSAAQAFTFRSPPRWQHRLCGERFSSPCPRSALAGCGGGHDRRTRRRPAAAHAQAVAADAARRPSSRRCGGHARLGRAGCCGRAVSRRRRPRRRTDAGRHVDRRDRHGVACGLAARRAHPRGAARRRGGDDRSQHVCLRRRQRRRPARRDPRHRSAHRRRSGSRPPAAPSSDQAGAAIGRTAYIVGGYTGAHWLDTIVAWQPGGPARVVAHLPHALRYAAVAAAGARS